MPREEKPPLSEAEFQSLANLAGGAAAESVPPVHRQKLIRLGLLKKSGVEFRVTSDGRTRVMLGR